MEYEHVPLIELVQNPIVYAGNDIKTEGLVRGLYEDKVDGYTEHWLGFLFEGQGLEHCLPVKIKDSFTTFDMFSRSYLVLAQSEGIVLEVGGKLIDQYGRGEISKSPRFMLDVWKFRFKNHPGFVQESRDEW